MGKRKMVLKELALLACLLLFTTSLSLAQDTCESNYDYDYSPASWEMFRSLGVEEGDLAQIEPSANCNAFCKEKFPPPWISNELTCRIRCAQCEARGVEPCEAGSGPMGQPIISCKCGDECCQLGKKCCTSESGDHCCGLFEECCEGGCAPFLSECCGEGYCPFLTSCCKGETNGICCNFPQQKCCKGETSIACCGVINECCFGECCNLGETCCGVDEDTKKCCPFGKECCKSEGLFRADCCESTEHCCSGECCTEEEFCTDDSCCSKENVCGCTEEGCESCCSSAEICCGGKECCDAENCVDGECKGCPPMEQPCGNWCCPSDRECNKFQNPRGETQYICCPPSQNPCGPLNDAGPEEGFIYSCCTSDKCCPNSETYDLWICASDNEVCCSELGSCSTDKHCCQAKDAGGLTITKCCNANEKCCWEDKPSLNPIGPYCCDPAFGDCDLLYTCN